jgi:hypothetical protein
MVEVAANAFTLSVTVSNWMAGVLASFARLPWRKALQVCANALCAVVVFWGLQRLIFPSADFFIGYTNHRGFLLREESGGPLTVAKVLLLHGAVAPRIETGSDPKWGPILTVQRAPVASGTAYGPVALVSWLLLLALGAVGLRRAARAVVIVCVGVCLGQLALHAVYGEESFLYALHLTPVLIVAISFAAETRARWAALALAGIFVVAAAVNNGRQLVTALDMAERLRAEVPLRTDEDSASERPERLTTTPPRIP